MASEARMNPADRERARETAVMVLRIVDMLRQNVATVAGLLDQVPDAEVVDACRRLGVAVNDLDDRVWVLSRGLAHEGRW